MNSNNERVYKMSFASVYPHYINKVEKKGRTKAEVDEVIFWLTGYDEKSLQQHLDNKTNFEDFLPINPKIGTPLFLFVLRLIFIGKRDTSRVRWVGTAKKHKEKARVWHPEF